MRQVEINHSLEYRTRCPEGATLTNNGTLIVNGTLKVSGTLDGSGTLDVHGTLMQLHGIALIAYLAQGLSLPMLVAKYWFKKKHQVR